MTEVVEKKNFIEDCSIDSISAQKSSRIAVRRRGVASVDNTLNFMTGDITYEELQKIPGISTMALSAKENAGDISIFQKKDYTSPLSKSGVNEIAYWNIPLLKKFISEGGSIVPTRISGVGRKQQIQLKYAVKVARFLGLLPFVEY